MAKLNEGYYFKSSMFKVIDGEDEETNPGIYGKSLAEWLMARFVDLGYDKLEVIAEDWGWCIFVKEDNNSSFYLGCGSLDGEEQSSAQEDLEWHVFLFSEMGLFDFKSRFLNLLGKLDLITPLQKIDEELKSILVNAGITLQDQEK